MISIMFYMQLGTVVGLHGHLADPQTERRPLATVRGGQESLWILPYIYIYTSLTHRHSMPIPTSRASPTPLYTRSPEMPERL